MLNVGLTGNVASGKSTVADWFRAWGATVIDSDVLVRESQQPGSPVLAAIAEAFGPAILQQDGTLDRAALRRRVMGDAAARERLNGIVHPEVERRRTALLHAAEARGEPLVVSDIPLLFEATDPSTFDVIVLVDADPALRKARLMERRGLTEAEAETLMAAQWPVERKRAGSDFVIPNDGTLEQLRAAAKEVWDALSARAGRGPRDA